MSYEFLKGIWIQKFIINKRLWKEQQKQQKKVM